MNNSLNSNINRSKFGKDVAATFFTKILLIALKLSSSVITARFLGPAGRGLYYTTAQTSGVANNIGCISIGESLIYHVGTGDIAKSNLLGFVLTLIAFFTSIIFLGLYLISPFIAENIFKDSSENLMLLLYLMTPLLMFEYFATSALRGLKLFSVVNKLSLVTRLNIIIFLILALTTYSATAYYALAGYIAALLLNCIIYFVALYKAAKPKAFKLNKFSSVIIYGLKVHPGILLTEIEYRLDIFILLYFLNAAAVGIYSIGVTISQILWYASNSINSVLFPNLTFSASGEEKDMFTATVIKYNFLINLTILFFLVIFGKLMVFILYGSEYIQAYYIFLILAPGLLLDSIGRNVATWLKSEGKPLILSWVSFGTLILNIICNFLLIPNYGLYGAAFSSLISYIIRGVILFTIYRKYTGIKASYFFLWSKQDFNQIFVRARSVISSFSN
ncbi:polysaccharide biosynthesis C-terminal domain-containing protein [Gammaproteobacteria bacterium]|nr:polysaccharide biosynthesis C-terminal domain-containing protein [Gammaproteobacteria bacterium]